jgi:photosystem II stability/assembly factor-like uncharacterized protein
MDKKIVFSKTAVLIFSLIFLAASCNSILDPFGGSTGARGVFKSADNGETYYSANRLAKGTIGNLTVTSLVFDERNYDTLYLGSSTGIYKTVDAAATWQYILANISVTQIAVDPSNSDIIYAAGLSGGNGKVIKSLDGGGSWIDIYTEPSKTISVLSIAVSKINPSLVLAGLSSGEIIRSIDGGRTWAAAKNFSDRVADIQFGNGNLFYALTSHSGLFKSGDGINWTSMTNFIAGTTLSTMFNRPISVSVYYDLALDPRQQGTIYLATEQGLLRTVNGGADWAFMDLPVKNSTLKVSAVTVSPKSSNNVFVGIAYTILRTLNGGVSWETKELDTQQQIRGFLINPQSPNVIYLSIGTKQ